MAFIRHRGKTYSVVYKILDENGEEHTTSETFATQKEADKRKKEIFRWIFLGGLLLFVTFPVFTQ